MLALPEKTTKLMTSIKLVTTFFFNETNDQQTRLSFRGVCERDTAAK